MQQVHGAILTGASVLTDTNVIAALAAGHHLTRGLIGADEVQEGDIITSPRFHFARHNHGSEFLEVGLDAPYVCAKTVRSQFAEEDLMRYDASDESRASAPFVVEHVERQTFYRGNIDGVIVTARRLGEDGQLDVDGERIRFMMSCPVGRLIPEVERVGRVTEQAVQLSYVIQRF